MAAQRSARGKIENEIFHETFVLLQIFRKQTVFRHEEGERKRRQEGGGGATASCLRLQERESQETVNVQRRLEDEVMSLVKVARYV